MHITKTSGVYFSTFCSKQYKYHFAIFFQLGETDHKKGHNGVELCFFVFFLLNKITAAFVTFFVLYIILLSRSVSLLPNT